MGLGYVPPAFAAIDTPLFIKVRDKMLNAKVVKLPFA
ncbi:MAG: hypothetical protein LC101_00020 [Flavobacteriales bacterium]|nr:hypothetical protein [Flavobacteriales bacterium]